MDTMDNPDVEVYPDPAVVAGMMSMVNTITDAGNMAAKDGITGIQYRQMVLALLAVQVADETNCNNMSLWATHPVYQGWSAMVEVSIDRVPPKEETN